MAKTTTKPAADVDEDPAAEDDAPAAPETITLEFRGQTFEVPKRRGRWPIEAILQFGRGQGLQAIRELIGPEDWKRLKTVCPTGDDFDEFLAPAMDVLMSQAVL